jgi:hypothetical protein
MALLFSLFLIKTGKNAFLISKLLQLGSPKTRRHTYNGKFEMRLIKTTFYASI